MVEFRVLDENFNVHSIIDTYQSAIWTVRSNECGDFEIYSPVTYDILDRMQIGKYLFHDSFYNENTDIAKLMIIETMEIESDPDEGNMVKYTGRDLKSILERRIVLGQYSFDVGTSVTDIIQKLLIDAIIDPQDWSKSYQNATSGYITISVSGSDRKISNFVFVEPNEDMPTITGAMQYDFTNLYESINELCNTYKVAYDILYNFTTKNFEFHLYNYRDRSYDQYTLSPILFSPSFDNLKKSNYIESISTEKTFGLIIGEGDEYNRMFNIIGSGTGLDRKELNISASDVSRTLEDGTEYGNETYLNMLLEKGQTEMENNKLIRTYEGESDTTRGFEYLKDFDIGDIVEITNEWGISSKVLISEVVMSISTDSITIIPTFSNYEERGDD